MTSQLFVIEEFSKLVVYYIFLSIILIFLAILIHKWGTDKKFTQISTVFSGGENA